MVELKLGYARVSAATQDLIGQGDALIALGVEPQRVYVDHGLTGTNRARPGLREAMAACRTGNSLVVTRLDRSVPDARVAQVWQVATTRVATETGRVIIVPEAVRQHPDRVGRLRPFS